MGTSVYHVFFLGALTHVRGLVGPFLKTTRWFLPLFSVNSSYFINKIYNGPVNIVHILRLCLRVRPKSIAKDGGRHPPRTPPFVDLLF